MADSDAECISFAVGTNVPLVFSFAVRLLKSCEDVTTDDCDDGRQRNKINISDTYHCQQRLHRRHDESVFSQSLLWSPYGRGQSIIFLSCGFFFLLSLWSPYAIGQTIIFLPCDFYISSFFFFFSSPSLSGRRLDVYHTWCGLSANLRCRSETCCMRLAGNSGRKKVAKNRHLGTIAQLCRAISSQLRHLSTSEKKLVKQRYALHMSTQYGERRPTNG